MINIEDSTVKNKGDHILAPLFSYGFRPFFLLAGLYAAISILLWVFYFQGFDIPLKWDNSILWHGHEMVFGFAAAVIAGFLLTAVPNWTGIGHIRDLPLIFLTMLWLAARIMMLTPTPDIIAAVVDILFLPCLAFMLLPSLIKTGNMKNVLFICLPLILAACNLAIHLEITGFLEDSAYAGLMLSVLIVLQMITVMAGRVFPMFTRNGLMHKGIQIVQKPHSYINAFALISLPVFILVFVSFGEQHIATAVAAFVVAIIHAIRLYHWQGIKAFSVPIIWVLHVGYLWFPVGFFLFGLYALMDIGNLQAPLHALTAGVMGTVILGMMSRVALGHTGRQIHAAKLTVVAYIILQISIVLRIASGYVTLFNSELILVSGLLWAVTFALFCFVYAPILLKKNYAR